MKYDLEFLIELKIILEGKLNVIETEILDFKPEDDDAKFKDLIRIGVYYRDQIYKINKELEQL